MLPKAMALVSVACLITVVGCATIMHGTNQEVGLSSSPTGAQVSVDNKPVGTTPLVTKLTRKDHHIVKMELPGYQPFEATVTRSVSGWVWGNIVFGGILGLAVDAITGGLYKLSPEQVSGTLAKSVGVIQGPDDLFIAVVLTADPQWEKIGSLSKK